MVSQSKKRIRRFSFAVKIVILDDELEFSKILDKKIKAYCARKDLLYDCKIFSSSKSLLSEDLSSVQAAFLDIDLPDLNGLEIAAILRQRYPEMVLIFVTSFIEYAPSGYKVNAFRNLLKAKLDEELSSCMDDLQEKLYENNRVIQIRQKDRFLPIAIKDILYFEGTSQRRVQAILTCGETIECLGKLEDYDQFLSEQGFIRLQKSFLVNMQYIDKMASYSAQLRNNVTIKVSEKNYKAICRKFLLWKGMNL